MFMCRIIREFRRQGGLRNLLRKAVLVYNTHGMKGIGLVIGRKIREIFFSSGERQLHELGPSALDQSDYRPYYDNYMTQLTNSQVKSREFVQRRKDISAKAPTPVKLVAYYLPQYHPFPENDNWWGKGFTEWTNVTKAQPHFVGHYQPRLPADLGFYDLRLPEVQVQQIEMAKQYGVHGFCYYYYWFNGKRLLDSPLRQMLENKKIDFPFCVSWANENWTRGWDGLDEEILIKQEYFREDEVKFIMDIEPILKDHRYIKVDGKPLLIIYGIYVLPNPARAVRTWREYCRKSGLGEIYVAATKRIPGFDPRKYGCDAAIEFPPVAMPLTWDVPNHRFLFPNCAAKLYDYRALIPEIQEMIAQKAEFPVFHGVMPSWDNTARRSDGKSYVFTHASPEEYEKWLRLVCEHTDLMHKPEEKVVFINAWNEWAEGAYIEPDRRYGFAYLEATAQVMESIQVRNYAESHSRNFGQVVKKDGEIAVVLHLYFFDLWDEIAAYLDNITEPFDLYISIPERFNCSAIDKVIQKYPSVHIRPVENRGRDIGPFLTLLAEIMPRNYEAVCKIHTKKSDHLNKGRGWKPENGDNWRSQLFTQLLGSRETVQEIITAFRCDATIGILGPKRDVMHYKDALGKNEALVSELQRRLHVPQTGDFEFFAGSMFWFRPEALMPILALNLTIDDFPMETGQIDGTLAHALERLFNLSASKLNYKVCTTK